MLQPVSFTSEAVLVLAVGPNREHVHTKFQ